MAKPIITIKRKAIFATQLFDSKKSLDPSTTDAELKSLKPVPELGPRSIPKSAARPAPGSGDASAPGNKSLNEGSSILSSGVFDDDDSAIYIYIYILDIKYLYKIFI
jgi:hypothetical protein